MIPTSPPLPVPTDGSWTTNPAWWALLVALVGMAGMIVNLVLNILNWRRSAVPKVGFRVEWPENSDMPTTYLLRNVGSITTTNTQFRMDDYDPPEKGMPDIRPKFSGDRDHVDLSPGEAVSFEMGWRRVVPGSAEPIRRFPPWNVTVTCDQVKGYLVVDSGTARRIGETQYRIVPICRGGRSA
ncbi:MAG: hypothetical protein FWF43_06475 [Propionibacteriaceae bacterium]|nr:hypothetical protein [Propionibacteriaceae bacterium]